MESAPLFEPMRRTQFATPAESGGVYASFEPVPIKSTFTSLAFLHPSGLEEPEANRWDKKKKKKKLKSQAVKKERSLPHSYSQG